METVLMFVAAIVAFGVSYWVGDLVGKRLRTAKPWRYWAANAIALVVGLALSAAGLFVRQDALYLAALGEMAGALTGLKYGLGVVVNQWREPEDDAEE